MKKQDVATFFDQCAPWWDADMIRSEEVITKILDHANIEPNVHVLDVACGTGVLFPDYLQRNVASITGIDISPNMAKIASEKFPQVHVICGDVEEVDFNRMFDRVMVYNAFPHFPDPQRLIQILATLVHPGGRLSIAHGMSRAALADHHAGRASSVSIDLIHEEELASILSPWFDVDVMISDDQMYQVCGTRNDTPAERPREYPLAESLAMLKFMISHNDAHSQELADLAGELKAAGKLKAYRQIMESVAEFDVANTRLRSVLDDLSEK